MRAFSSCRGRGYSSLRCTGFLLRWLLLLQSSESRHMGFSCCNTQAQQLWLRGLVTPRHVESSRIKDRTHVPSIGRWIAVSCATRESRTVNFCKLITYSATLLNSPLILIADSFGFFYESGDNMQIPTALTFPFKFFYLVFFLHYCLGS